MGRSKTGHKFMEDYMTQNPKIGTPANEAECQRAFMGARQHLKTNLTID